MEEKNEWILEHELKCRRCGEISSHVSQTIDKNTTDPYYIRERETFPKKMEGRVANPPLRPCTVCKKQTVHDVVSYTDIYEQD